MTIYNDDRDIIGNVLRENQNKEDDEQEWGEAPQDSNVGTSATLEECYWEYTTSPPSVNVCKGGVTNTEEVHGPFPTWQMREWNRLGAFTADQLWLRRHGQEWIFKKSVDMEELLSQNNPQNAV